MTKILTGRHVAVLAADGVQEVELVQPRQAVEDAGATTELLSIKEGSLQAVNQDIKSVDTYPVDKLVSDASPDDYDALILPGGVANPGNLRGSAAMRFVQAFVDSGKPVGVICHGPWTLIGSGVVRGRTMTSHPRLRTGVRDAGGTVADEEVVSDLPAFCREIVAEFADGRRQAS
ncbi:MAG: DJ-1/PfpI family protein [Kibdelosporangium sp.]